MKVFALLCLLAVTLHVGYAATYPCNPFNACTRTTYCTSGQDPANYCPVSSKYKSACNIPSASLPPNLASATAALFPEGGNPDPSMIRSDIFVYFTQKSNLSVTYISSIAGNTNRMGLTYYRPATKTVSNIGSVFERTNSESNGKCWTIGDTLKFGEFLKDDLVVFYLDGSRDTSKRFYSYLLADTPLTNPDTSKCGSLGCVHSAWAYLTSQDVTVFGFEDLSLGDADYNDLLFFLQVEGNATFNEVPPYEDGLLKVCNPNSGVTSTSMAIVNCTQWAILESLTATQSCLTYMPIPAGWAWAPDDETSRAVIIVLSSRWSYTNANCFLLSTNATHGVGYRPNGDHCLANEYSISTVMNGTKICYNAKCTSRFVLKGLDLGTTCSAANRCSPDAAGNVLAYEPSTPAGVTTFPSAYSVYLRYGTGSVAISSSLHLPGGYYTTQAVDVVILVDFTTASSSTQQNNLISSYNNLMSAFGNQQLDARVAFVQYRPTGSSTYTLTTDYTFYANPPALSTSNFHSGSCPSSGNAPMYNAIAEVMNNNVWAWRSTAFKLVWVISACDMDQKPNVAAASRATGIVPIFAWTGSSKNVPTNFGGWNPSTSNRAPMYSIYSHTNKDGSAWASGVFDTSSSSRGVQVIRPYPTSFLIIPASGDVAFVRNLPTTADTSSRDTGSATINYEVAWPSSGYPYNALATYSTTLRIMGRGTTNIAINFNRAPVLSDSAYTLTSGTNQTINLNPTDADGNTLNIVVVTYPTIGKLYDTSGNLISSSNQLPAGVYNLIYVPNDFASGSDSAVVRVSDGCETDDATLTFTVNFANTPPVARDIVISMEEDSDTSGTNGQIDFNPYISDADIDRGQPQTLTVSLLTMPSPSARGQLTTYSTGAPVTATGTIAKVLRYVLTQPRSGYGNVTFSYRVSDGTTQGNALSNIATVTVMIIHKNHPPVLTITNTRLYMQTSAPSDITISGYITDIDYALDTTNLYVINDNLTAFTVTAGTGGDMTTFGPPQTTPFKLYTNDLTSSSSNFMLSNFIWKSSTTTALEYIELEARDSAGATSNTVKVYLETIPANPPVWTDRPLNSSNAYAPLTTEQGVAISGMRFAATDADSGQYQTLVFTTTTFPSNGAITIQPLSSGAAVPITSAGFSNPGNASFVGLSAPNSYYRVTYTPNPTFYGTDTFTFSVRDINGYSAAESATVVVNVNRANTRPVSDDISINTLEQVTGTGQIPLSSTNSPSNAVYLRLESVNFAGSLQLSPGVSWNVGDLTTPTTSGFVAVYATGSLGTFSAPGVPTGTFTYTVHESATSLSGSRTYTGQIFITHVNHPPTSENKDDTVRRGVLLPVTLAASDPDADDVLSTLTIKFTGIGSSSKGSFFYDAAETQPLNFQTLDTPLTDRTFYYRSNDFFSTNNQPLATYNFIAIDNKGLQSERTYAGTITVLPAGYPPTAGVLDVYTYQETPVPMVLAAGVVTETGTAPLVTVTSFPDPQLGTFSICDDNAVCTPPTSAPQVVTSSTGRVVFAPRDYDWGMNFTSFDFTLTDVLSGAVGTYTMRIHVIHVNKRPSIEAMNFLTTSETNAGVIVNESSWHSFDWRVWDVDSLPAVLTTSLRVTFYTSQGFSLYTCVGSPSTWNTAECQFNVDDAPFAVRSDFSKNARRIINSYETAVGDCPDANALKTRYGSPSRNCEARFKFAFAPTPLASYTPYISISFTGWDDEEGESNTISVLINVKAVNAPPTIWAPALVTGASGVTNPFLRDTDQASATYNFPVSVDDSDSNGNPELLTISVTSGSGNLVWPPSVPCEVSSESSTVWYCRDRIASFNQWLGDLRFEVTNGDRASLHFEINDLGFSSDYKPSPNLTATADTSVVIVAAIAAPKGNSQTLAIAVGVAAAAGLLLLGALGFFLRKAVSPPTDDYFAAATTPLSAAPQSPLYQAQNQTYENVLYKGQN